MEAERSAPPGAGGASSKRIAWGLPPSRCRLAPDEVHLWCAELDGDGASAPLPVELLAPAERARAERFRFSRDRRRFIAARAVLRRILGRCLARPPAEIGFDYGPHGKPCLAALDGGRAESLAFNLAHSGGLALIAVAWGRRLGVDLEAVRPLADLERIARRYFSPAEAASLLCLPVEQRPQAFFSCWTRKEAYLKATGEGIGALGDEPDPAASARWSLVALDPAPGFVAALAIEAEAAAIRLRRWQYPWGADAAPATAVVP
jgi:4'-phosphopantetheinyl transferase